MKDFTRLILPIGSRLYGILLGGGGRARARAVTSRRSDALIMRMPDERRIRGDRNGARGSKGDERFLVTIEPREMHYLFRVPRKAHSSRAIKDTEGKVLFATTRVHTVHGVLAKRIHERLRRSPLAIKIDTAHIDLSLCRFYGVECVRAFISPIASGDALILSYSLDFSAFMFIRCFTNIRKKRKYHGKLNITGKYLNLIPYCRNRIERTAIKRRANEANRECSIFRPLHRTLEADHTMPSRLCDSINPIHCESLVAICRLRREIRNYSAISTRAADNASISDISRPRP